MSVVKSNTLQVGQSLTASQNFCWYQPSSPDGTVRLGNGNAGSVTDLVTVSSSGNINLINDLRWGTWSSGTSGQVVTATTSASGYVAMYTSGVERLRLDSSGNLGLGVTPSGWNSSWKAFQFGSVGAAFSNSSNAIWSGNEYLNSGGTPTYITSQYALRYRQDVGSGYHAWFTAPSGTAGNAISFTQAMTLDASGNLLVGNTNAGGSNGSSIVIGPTTTSAGVSVSAIYGNSSTTTVNSQTYNLTFNSSAKVFSVALASGDACLVVTNYLTTTITILGATTNIVASASPTANQLGISKSAASHVITFKTGSSAATAFGSWSIQSLTSTVA